MQKTASLNVQRKRFKGIWLTIKVFSKKDLGAELVRISKNISSKVPLGGKSAFF